MTRIARVFMLSTLVGALGCADESPGEFRAAWTGSEFRLSDPGGVELLAEREEGVLWVVGDGVSIPLGYEPSAFQTTQDGTSAKWPDVVIPDTIAAGTRLAIYSVADGVLDQRLAELVIDPDAEVPYVTVTDSRKSCSSGCNATANCSCNWCKYCQQIGRPCNGHSVFSTTYSASRVCNLVRCGCSDDPNNHYCVTVWARVFCG